MRGGAGPPGTARARALKVTAAPLSCPAPAEKSYPRGNLLGCVCRPSSNVSPAGEPGPVTLRL